MRVLIADDHSIVRSGMKLLVAELAPDAQIVEATTFPQAHEAAEGPNAFDLAIVDLRMPGFAGLESLAELADKLAPSPVVVFSMYENPDEMRAVLGAGVKAFIPKSTDDGLIVSILRLVLAGGTYVPPVLGGIGRTAEGLQMPEPPSASPIAVPAALANLTRRQQQVLGLLAQGLSNMEIGRRLGLNLSTVKTHVTGILKALGVENRTQAVLALREMGRDQ